MEDKTIITYIKNGEEKVLTFNDKKINKLIFDFKLKDIFYIHVNGKDKVVYDINDNVSFVHIKNYCFKENVRISCSGYNDKLLILEDCTFEKEDLEIDRINYLKVLNPKFNVTASIDINKAKDVNVLLTDEAKNVGINVSDVSKFYLDASLALKILYLENVYDVYLKNVESQVRTLPIGIRYEMNMTLDNCFFESCNLALNDHIYYYLKLVDSKIYSSDFYINLNNIVKLNLENSSIISDFRLSFSYLRELHLKSSYIKSEKRMRFDNIEKIIFDDEGDTILDTSSYLESGKSIRIKNRVIERYSLVNNLIINEKSLNEDVGIKRQLLKFILKDYKNKLEHDIEEELKKAKRIQKEELKLIHCQNKEKLKKHKTLLLSKSIKDL